jgi:hypothetical protein
LERESQSSWSAGRAFQMLATLSGLSRKRLFVPPNQPIWFSKSIHTKASVISEQLNRQYIPPFCSDPLTRRIRRNLYKSHPLSHDFTPFTAANTDEAIRNFKSSTTTGPDGLTSLHLKKLGPAAISYLTSLFNLSARDAVVPQIWKKALVLPVLKPCKPPDPLM